VKPKDAPAERSGGPVPDDTAAHPAEAAPWEQFLSRGNLAQALRPLEQNAGAAGVDVLALIRRYLEAGVMADGLVHASEEGTPQGSPLSPLLSNVMLDDLDSELERRGHRFARYADDVMVYVASKRAGQRVMESLACYVEQRLKLKVNHEKSAVAWAGKRPFSGLQLLAA
jgi:hypothetical protein